MENDPYSVWVILSNINITFFTLTPGTVGCLIGIITLLACSALVSGSEVAFFSLKPTDFDWFKNNSSKKTDAVIELISKPKELLATILVANNFVNIAIVMLSTYTSNSLIDFSNAPVLGFIFEVVIITFLLLLFGEVIPKVFANKYALRVSKIMALPFVALIKIFKPITIILTASTKIVDRRFHKKNNISMDEISDAIEITSDSIAEDKGILKGIIEYGNIEVSEIMCPRVDVVAFEIHETYNQIIKKAVETGYSRIPVYDGTFDNITGVLYLKDLLPHFDKPDNFNWQNLKRPPYFVPEGKKINELLEELQKNKIHMAIVVDEYGGTSGIITMEDIIEEIIGDISDEFDGDEERDYIKINDNTYIFEGKTLINDACKVLNLPGNYFDDIRGEADTLAGIILEITGIFPSVHEKIKYKKITFTIEEFDNRRIKKIKTTINK